MQDLIQEAGLSVGAVYRYFKSKDEIINAISQTVAGGLAAVLTEIAAEDDLTLVGSLSRVLDVIDEQVAPGGNFPLAIQVWSEATLDPAIAAIVRERYLELRMPFLVIAKRAAARGEVAAGADPEAVAATLFGFIPAYATQRQLVGSPDKETFLSGVRALLTR
ncbi:TetR/AcrR family transcriptional regulator [Actinoplanes sp. NPDC049316]|uniref:TetR/AcrR family transcriptional regulator n=1 Tax=Actinoplanes sp. NPDC049316 TaxID=3154727 RepID=UPI003422D18A